MLFFIRIHTDVKLFIIFLINSRYTFPCMRIFIVIMKFSFIFKTANVQPTIYSYLWWAYFEKIIKYKKKLYPQIKIGLSSYHIYIQLLELLSTFMHNRVLITYTCYYIWSELMSNCFLLTNKLNLHISWILPPSQKWPSVSKRPFWQRC